MSKDKTRLFDLIVRIVLFVLILGLGLVTALALDETPGLALADLSTAPVRVMAPAVGTETLYAVLADGFQPSGVYRSGDGGRTWQLASTEPIPAFTRLVVQPGRPGTLFATVTSNPGNGTNSLWRSDDSGQTWRKFWPDVPANADQVPAPFTDLALDPNQPEFLYLGTAGQGVYRFAVSGEGNNAYLVDHITLADNAVVKKLVLGPNSQVYALTDDSLYRIQGSGSQQLVAPPETAISLAVVPTNPPTLYVGTPTSGLYRSADSGQTWEAANEDLGLIPGAALRVTALAVDTQTPGRVVAATTYGVGSWLAGGGIFERTKNGRWHKMAELDRPAELVVINQGTVYAATARGLARYGQAAISGAVIPLTNMRSLTHPSGSQVLVLVLATGLAGLALLGRVDWIFRRNSNSAAV